MKKSGIYKITCLVNGKVYIGSAVDLEDREFNHFNKKAHNRLLRRAFKFYGKENFKFEILELVENENLLLYHEQYYLDTLLFAQEYIFSGKKDKRFRNLSYNISPTAGSNLNVKRSKESNKKQSETRKRKFANGEIVSWSKGKKGIYSKEVLKQMSDSALKRKPRTEESIKKGLETRRLRHPVWMPHTEETKQKISKKNLDKVGPNRMPVVQLDMQGNFIAYFVSCLTAYKELGINAYDIGRTCKGKFKQMGGFKWMFKSEYEKLINLKQAV